MSPYTVTQAHLDRANGDEEKAKAIASYETWCAEQDANEASMSPAEIALKRAEQRLALLQFKDVDRRKRDEPRIRADIEHWQSVVASERMAEAA